MDVLIRPESILVSLDPFGRDQVHGKVEAARLLGRTTLVHLSLLDEQEGKLHIHARVPGPFQPDPGASGFDPIGSQPSLRVPAHQ